MDTYVNDNIAIVSDPGRLDPGDRRVDRDHLPTHDQRRTVLLEVPRLASDDSNDQVRIRGVGAHPVFITQLREVAS